MEKVKNYWSLNQNHTNDDLTETYLTLNCGRLPLSRCRIIYRCGLVSQSTATISEKQTAVYKLPTAVPRYFKEIVAHHLDLGQPLRPSLGQHSLNSKTVDLRLLSDL